MSSRKCGEGGSGKVTSIRNTKLTVEYDGTDFFGWQVQGDKRTVQGELEKALSRLLDSHVKIVGSGRTDAGVHALGQVANFKTTSNLSSSNILRGGNSLLPDDIIIREARDVSSDFHARFDARSRRYAYRITGRKKAVGRQYAWYVYYPLDLSIMNEAAMSILGQNDFTSFCVADGECFNPRCHILDTRWLEKDGELTFEIESDRFLQHMVRTIVGTLVEIGRGRWGCSKMTELLDLRDRRKAGPTAPAHGLYLAEVRY